MYIKIIITTAVVLISACLIVAVDSADQFVKKDEMGQWMDENRQDHDNILRSLDGIRDALKEKK